MVSIDALQQHYERCRRLFEDARSTSGLSYLGLDEPWRVERVPSREADRLVSSEHIQAVFSTSERSVDPRTVAPLLKAALEASSRISFIGNTRVTSVTRTARGRLVVHGVCDGAYSAEAYDHVANTLWHGRLEIDATLGLAPERPWLYRYKFGSRIRVALRPETPPLAHLRAWTLR